MINKLFEECKSIIVDRGADYEDGLWRQCNCFKVQLLNGRYYQQGDIR